MSDTDVLYRTATLTADDTDGDGERTVTMRIVPYDTETDIGYGVRESFAPGSVTPYDPDQGVLLRLEHSRTIDRFTEITDDPDAGGAIGTAVIARTPTGDEAWELVRAGVLTRCSIGFRPSASQRTVTENEDGTETWRWTRAAIIEASLVSFPAHPTAAVTSYRKDPTMNTTTPTAPPATDSEVRQALDDLTREVSTVRARLDDMAATGSRELELSFRSIGDYARALASGSDEAARAYEGSTTADAIVKAPWLGVLTSRMAAKQPVLNMLTHTTNLPSTGMSVEYGKHGASTVQVTAHAEGTNLVAGKVSMTTATAPVKTYGGIGAMTYEEIQRASVSLLDDLLSEQAVAYARAIESDVRAEFERVVTDAEASPLATAALTSTDPAWWLGAVLDMVDAYDDTPHTLTGLAVSGDVFRHLAGMKEERTALQITGAPDDKVGTLTVSVPSANLYGLTVTRVPKWDGLHAVAYDSAAIRCMESAGAPMRLQQDNIVNLTKNFAVYGYAAVVTPAAGAVMALSLTK